MYVVFLSLLVIACDGSVSEEEFRDEWPDLACRTVVDCMDELEAAGQKLEWETEEECVAMLESDVSDICDYDEEAAKDCLDALRSTSCDDLIASGEPETCDEVYESRDC